MCVCVCVCVCGYQALLVMKWTICHHQDQGFGGQDKRVCMHACMCKYSLSLNLDAEVTILYIHAYKGTCILFFLYCEPPNLRLS